MSMTLTPSSGPMATFAPGAVALLFAPLFSGLVTARRRQDQGREAYGRMRELQYPRRPGERRDPYAVKLQLEDGANGSLQQQATVVMGPGVRRDDERRELASCLLRGLQHRDVIGDRRAA